ncbi:uncharacterized protein LY89DRAFT_687755 [Mollisia scopiformis]|uniref:N-acetyltransferase domain-containing protein n=1 Tax=Mollisia scopiformis TaxID=149040 RepID=A0A194WYX2_MOLSC|nr:uncharacterized protein LY89DRAFT_687755 [Mollisia scopiformis]KUJ12792.1 hypothetical protein LY89DRAFT_687755 [Mollisia scopiformis]
MSSPNPPFTIHPATPADIPRLTHIYLVALSDDPPAQIKFPSSTAFNAAVTAMLEKQIGDPKWCIMKAVDTFSGEIGSWGSWLEHSASDADQRPSKHQHEEGENGEEEEEEEEDEGKFDFNPGRSRPLRYGAHECAF